MCSSANARSSFTLRTPRRCAKIQDQGIIHRPQNQFISDVQNLRVSNESSPSENSCIRIHVRYLNDEGRLLALTHAVEIHHDFSRLSPIMSITILSSSLSLLQSSPSIEYAGGDGAVFFL
jgi:hypothetical protein